MRGDFCCFLIPSKTNIELRLPDESNSDQHSFCECLLSRFVCDSVRRYGSRLISLDRSFSRDWVWINHGDTLVREHYYQLLAY